MSAIGGIRWRLARLRDFIGQKIRRIGDEAERVGSCGVGRIEGSNQVFGGINRGEEGDRISGDGGIEGVSRRIGIGGDGGRGGATENDAAKWGDLGGEVEGSDRT